MSFHNYLEYVDYVFSLSTNNHQSYSFCSYSTFQTSNSPFLINWVHYRFHIPTISIWNPKHIMNDYSFYYLQHSYSHHSSIIIKYSISLIILYLYSSSSLNNLSSSISLTISNHPLSSMHLSLYQSYSSSSSISFLTFCLCSSKPNQYYLWYSTLIYVNPF